VQPSMDKLYDLMTMGLKYQLIACRHAAGILDVTLNHLSAVRDCINDPQVIDLVNSCEELLNLHYQGFAPGDWMQLRQSLVGFFHNKRIKVSLFLQEGLQVNSPCHNPIAESCSRESGVQTDGTIVSRNGWA
jgi:hypothetical protein